MTIAILSSFFGLLLLYFGAEGLVRGSSSLGLRFGLSPLVVGLTIVAFGTSAPELAVSMNAAYVGQSDLSIGNVVGSNIANIGLILGISVMVQPLSLNIQIIRIDIPIMIGVSILFCMLIFDANLSRIDGLLLVSGVIAFTVFNVIKARQAKPKDKNAFESEILVLKDGLTREIVFIFAGLTLLIVGGKLLVDGAVHIARVVGISEAVIGLTVVAVGTSLPEMATSILAATKKMSDLAIGNVVGSNIFNILGVLGASSLLSPLAQGNVTWIDIGVMIFFSLVVLTLARNSNTLKRRDGLLLFAGYVGYIIWLVAGSS